MDTDKSGSLSKVEFRSVLKGFGLDLPDVEFTAFFQSFDKDGDGVIHYDEVSHSSFARGRSAMTGVRACRC